MNEQYYNSCVQSAPAQRIDLVTEVSTRWPRGNSAFGVVQSICYAWMFDEGTGIKSQECAGIQMCVWVHNIINHTSLWPHYWIGPSNSDRRGFAAPCTSEQPTLLKATASLWTKRTPCLICQLCLLLVPENPFWKKKENVWFNDPRPLQALCTSPSYWI